MNKVENFQPALIAQVMLMWLDHHPRCIADRLTARYGIKISEQQVWNLRGMARRLDIEPAGSEKN